MLFWMIKNDMYKLFLMSNEEMVESYFVRVVILPENKKIYIDIQGLKSLFSKIYMVSVS